MCSVEYCRAWLKKNGFEILGPTYDKYVAAERNHMRVMVPRFDQYDYEERKTQLEQFAQAQGLPLPEEHE